MHFPMWVISISAFLEMASSSVQGGGVSVAQLHMQSQVWDVSLLLETEVMSGVPIPSVTEAAGPPKSHQELMEEGKLVQWKPGMSRPR